MLIVYIGYLFINVLGFKDKKRLHVFPVSSAWTILLVFAHFFYHFWGPTDLKPYFVDFINILKINKWILNINFASLKMYNYFLTLEHNIFKGAK